MVGITWGRFLPSCHRQRRQQIRTVAVGSLLAPLARASITSVFLRDSLAASARAAVSRSAASGDVRSNCMCLVAEASVSSFAGQLLLAALITLGMLGTEGGAATVFVVPFSQPSCSEIVRLDGGDEDTASSAGVGVRVLSWGRETMVRWLVVLGERWSITR